MLDRKSTTSEYLHNLFLQNQLDLVPEIELSSNDLLIDLARIGLGIAFIPDFCLSQTSDSDSLFIVETKKYFRKGSLSSHITRKSRYPKPRRNFYLIFNTSFGCMTENTIGAYVPHGIFLLMLLISYLSVLPPSRILQSFLQYFHCYRSENHSTPSGTPPGTVCP